MKQSNVRQRLRAAGEAARERDLDAVSIARVHDEAARMLAVRAVAVPETVWTWRPAFALAVVVLALGVAVAMWVAEVGAPDAGALVTSAPAQVVVDPAKEFGLEAPRTRDALRAAEQRYVSMRAERGDTLTELDRKIATVRVRLQAEE